MCGLDKSALATFSAVLSLWSHLLGLVPRQGPAGPMAPDGCCCICHPRPQSLTPGGQGHIGTHHLFPVPRAGPAWSGCRVCWNMSPGLWGQPQYSLLTTHPGLGSETLTLVAVARAHGERSWGCLQAGPRAQSVGSS